MLPFDDLRLGAGVRLDAIIAPVQTAEAAIASGYPVRILDGDFAFQEPLVVIADKGDAEVEKYLQTHSDAQIYSEGVGQAWPTMKQKAMDGYYERHSVAKYGSKILGDSPGAQAMKRVLNQFDFDVTRL